jgi:cytochrome c
MKSRILCLAFLGVGASTALLAQTPGNVPKGKMAYQNQCANCHRITAENMPDGPGLAGIVGLKAGLREGFAYTDAMKKSGITWTEETLDKYLEAPEKVVPGTKMTLAVPKPADRANLIAYLKTLQPK